ncbi:MAG: CYTH domain-containing protein [Patescibacteria group bacterium]
MGQDNIEVEMRSVFDKNTYDRLKKFFIKSAKNLGEDDKDVYFFLLPDKLLKVVSNISKKTAKIVLKLNRIGQGSTFDENEIPISPNDCQKAVDMFLHLGFKEMQHTFQKRHNYLYKGVEMALKFSETWGYHLELEILIHDDKQKQQAVEKITEVANELDVHILSDDELTILTKKIDSKFRDGKYKK